MKVIDVTIVFHNRTMQVRKVGMWYNITSTSSRKVVEKFKLQPESVARRMVGNNAIDLILEKGDEIHGSTINVNPITL